MPSRTLVLFITAGFGGLTVLCLTTLQGLRISKAGQFSAGFRRSLSLVFIVVVAVAAICTDIPSDSRTALFTLLGTVAGYSIAADAGGGTASNKPFAQTQNGGGATGHPTDPE